MDQLNNYGYILIENTNKNYFQKKLNKFYNNDKVNYKILKNFIDNDYFYHLKNKLDFIKFPKYSKFRFSNNNNAKDASTFHGDLYNYTDDNIIPIFTFLYYFDDAQIELIPKSHRNDYLKSNDSNSSYNNKITLNIKAGSFLIFHANLHHRGINYSHNKNRRLLQIFDVFLNITDYTNYIDKINIINTSNNPLISLITNNFIEHLFYSNNQDFINYYHYYLVYNDLQYKITGSDLSPKQKINKIIGYEPLTRINYLDCNNYYKNNVNIIHDKYNTYIDGLYYLKTTNTSNYYFFLIISIIIIILIIIFSIIRYNY